MIRAKHRLTDKDCEAAFRKFGRLKPLLTEKQIELGEEAGRLTEHNWRIALVLGTKSGKELKEMVRKDKADAVDLETLAAMLLAVTAAKGRAETVPRIAAACEFRFLTALCHRDDMEEIRDLADRMRADADAVN